ncbi:PxKF domain-containing protein [Oryzobacter sp. R7]|uniref:PxKF domain-containing protein n=1 Tax=Oryzobacter faecalis TaxID=3388656 RepID=UPI00398D0321
MSCPSQPQPYTGSAQTPCSASVSGPGLNQSLTVGYSNNTNAGTATASASYTGTANLAASSDSENFTIGQATTTVTVTCAPGPYTYTGSPITPSCTASANGPGLDEALTVTYSDNTNAGTATASAGYAGDANHAPATGTTTFQIGKAAPDCSSITGYTGVYDGEAHGATGTCVGVDGEVLADLDLGATFTDVPGGTANWSLPASANHESDSGSVSISIGGATPDCAVDGYSGVYDGEAHGATGTCVGVDGEDLEGDLDLGATFTDVPGGTATWSFTPDSGNYVATGGTVDIVITPATPVCDVDGYTDVYDGEAHGASGSCVGVKGETLSGLELGDTFTDVPGGTASWSIPASTNYLADSGAAAITITQAAPDCSGIAGYSGVYDGDPHGASGNCVGVKGETLSGLDLGDTFTDVPGGTASWSIPASTNYVADSGTAEIVITQATPVCDVVGYTGVYDAAAHGATGSCTGVNDEELPGLTLGDTFTNVPGGTAEWTFTGGTNYADDSGSVQIEISKATSTVTLICDGAKVYTGNAVKPCNATASRVGALPVELDVDYTDNVNAGPASASATWEGDGNHTGDSASEGFTIAKAAPICTITGYSGSYTATAHGALGTCVGVDGTDLTANLDRGGSYTDVPGGTATWTLSESANHLGASDTVTVTITPIDASCTISGFTGTYDGLAHGATGTCTGIGGESPGTLNLGATFTDVPGGTATWTLTGNDNYNDQTGTAPITIGKATADCGIVGYTGVYDAAAHGATGTCTGVNDEELPGLTLGDTFTNVPGGTAEWTFTGGTNYADDSGSVQIEISKATSTVTLICDGAKVYTGNAVKPCNATASRVGALPVELDVDYTDNVNAGPASASATWEGDGNHTGDSASEGFTIAKAAPICTITGYSGSYTATAHGALGTCVGVDGTDLTANLDRGGSYTDVPGGTATWTLSESANHLGASDTVTVTITPIDASCTISGFTGTYDGLAHGATGTCTGIGGESPGTLNLGATFTDVPGGTATWTLTGNDNYNDQTGTAPITIGKATSLVTVTCPVSVDWTGSAITPCTAQATGAGMAPVNLAPSYTNNVDAGTATASATWSGDVNHTGSTGSATFKIASWWTLKGFYQPVDMNNVLNTVKGGSTVPLKFEVFAGSTEKTTVDAVKSLAYAETSCTLATITDDIETVATGGTALRYDSTAGQFIYNWKTPSTAGKCYRVTMTTADGGTLMAYFKLK